MDSRIPPKLVNGPGLAASKQARADFFARLQRRDRTPRTVEVERLVEVPVETIREVEVERLVHVEVPVEVERVVYVDREVIREVPAVLAPLEPMDEPAIPDFLRYDPLSEFIQIEQREGESDEQTLQRLRDELLDLLTLEHGGPLTAVEEARKRHLSANIKPTGD